MIYICCLQVVFINLQCAIINLDFWLLSQMPLRCFISGHMRKSVSYFWVSSEQLKFNSLETVFNIIPETGNDIFCWMLMLIFINLHCTRTVVQINFLPLWHLIFLQCSCSYWENWQRMLMCLIGLRVTCRDEWFLCQRWWMSGRKSRSASLIIIFILFTFYFMHLSRLHFYNFLILLYPLSSIHFEKCSV